MKRLRWLAISALLVAGCGGTPEQFHGYTPPDPDPVATGQLDQQAHEVLDRWEAAYDAAPKPGTGTNVSSTQ